MPLETATKNIPSPPQSRRFFFLLILLIIIILVGAGIFSYLLFFSKSANQPKNPVVLTFGDKKFTQNDITKHDQLVAEFYKSKLTDAQINDIISKRQTVIDFVKTNSITVSDAEVSNRKSQLQKVSSDSAILSDVSRYGWSMSDWNEMLWWQVLREKILDSFSAYRQGEVVTLRWDTLYPDPKAEAPTKSPVAAAYLEVVRTKLVDKTYSNLQAFIKTIDLTKPIEIGVDKTRLIIQYTGLAKDGSYFRFMIPKVALNSGTDYLSKTKFTEITPVTCDDHGCLFYNILAGSNGITVNQTIKDFLTANLII